MTEQRPRREAPSASLPAAPPSPLSGHVTQNVDSVLALHHRDRERRSTSERVLEFVGHFIGRPIYLLAVLGLVLLWIAGNTLAPVLGLRPFDAPPFALLQGLLTLGSFATTTVVVIAQRRQLRLESQRSHLDLQVNLLSEQKVTKVIHLLEELRRDLPMVRDRVDPEADALQRRADTEEVLSALEERGVDLVADPDPRART